MSAALVRQALELVDQEETTERSRGGRRRREKTKPSPYQRKPKSKLVQVKPQEQAVEETISRLLALGGTQSDSGLADKLLKRASKTGPALDFVPVPNSEPEKSILFPDDPPPGAEKKKKYRKRRGDS